MRVELDPNDRTALVRGVFSRIVSRYDLLNHVLSMGRDLFWRKAAASRINLFDSKRILDIAAGTGDMAISLAAENPGARVTGIDFTMPMLQRADEKMVSSEFKNRINFICGDALSLPFPDQSFDSATMAFGIRNIPHRGKALEEMHRVLVPGGKAIILELTFPRWSFVRKFYSTYLNRLIPKIGGMISGQTLAYQYLADSIMDFPSPEEFKDMMARAGFDRTGFIKYTFGVCVLHWGIKDQ